MKLPLQDFTKCAVRRVFDTETGAFDAASDDAPTRGYFMQLGDKPVVLYADRGALHLRVGDRAAPLSGAEVEVKGEGLRTLKVVRKGEVVISLSYPNPVNPPMEFDLTMAEEEDFDLGLFVHNVSASLRRRDALLAKWSA